MKKMFLILAMLIFASQAMAGTVTLTLSQDTNDCAANIVEVYYSSANDISGFGLVITADTNGAVITSVDGYHEGDSSTANGKGFGIFPESFSTYLDAADPNWNEPNYTPVAPNTAPGAAGTGIGTDTVILEMGALYEDTNEPNKVGLLCTFTVDVNCLVSITADSTRGNIVLADTTEATLVGGGATFVVGSGVCGGPPPCPNTVPACWSYATQCNGDSDGDGDVDTSDWPYFRDGFAKSHPQALYAANVCADYNRDGVIDTVDWPKFRDYFAKVPPATCPTGDLNGVYCP